MQNISLCKRIIFTLLTLHISMYSMETNKEDTAITIIKNFPEDVWSVIMAYSEHTFYDLMPKLFPIPLEPMYDEKPKNELLTQGTIILEFDYKPILLCGNIHRIDRINGCFCAILQNNAQRPLLYPSETALSHTFFIDPTQHNILVSEYNLIDGSMYHTKAFLFTVNNGNCIFTSNDFFSKRNNPLLTNATFTHDGAMLATIWDAPLYRDKTSRKTSYIHIWNLQHPENMHVKTLASPNDFKTVAFNNDNSLMVTLSKKNNYILPNTYRIDVWQLPGLFHLNTLKLPGSEKLEKTMSIHNSELTLYKKNKKSITCTMETPPLIPQPLTTAQFAALLLVTTDYTKKEYSSEDEKAFSFLQLSDSAKSRLKYIYRKKTHNNKKRSTTCISMPLSV